MNERGLEKLKMEANAASVLGACVNRVSVTSRCGDCKPSANLSNVGQVSLTEGWTFATRRSDRWGRSTYWLHPVDCD